MEDELQTAEISLEEKQKLELYLSNFSYNPQQIEFIHSPLENSKLIGIPGGGKTQSIIGKILYHYINNDFIKTQNYILLTFSKKTNLEFLQKAYSVFSDNDGEKYFQRSNVRTIHSLASRINQLYISEENETSQDTVIISALHHILQDSSKIVDIEELRDLKVIFVDESQDISSIQYEFICSLQKILNDIPINMIGDPNQNIYQFQKGNDYYLMNHPGRTYYLIQNYRSIPAIINLINYFRPWTELTPRMIPGRNMEGIENIKPIIFSGSIEEVLDNVIKKIKESKEFKRPTTRYKVNIRSKKKLN